MILAGDIGGTYTRLALFQEEPGCELPCRFDVYPNIEYDGLRAILRMFLGGSPESVVASACLAAAGPVKNGICEVTNVPWVLDVHQLAREFEFDSVVIVNDLEASAHGIAFLQARDFLTLQSGTADPTGNCALISAGTGLGEAGLLREGGAYLPFPSEGGHADFRPRMKLNLPCSCI